MLLLSQTQAATHWKIVSDVFPKTMLNFSLSLFLEGTLYSFQQLSFPLHSGIYEVSKRVLQEKKDSTPVPGKADFLQHLVLWSLDIVLKKLQALLKGLHKERPFAALQSTMDS